MGKRKYHRWSIRTIGWIRKETGCPFCRLIGLAVHEGQRNNLSLLEENIEISWGGLQDTSDKPIIFLNRWSTGITIRFVDEATFSDIILAGSQLDWNRARRWKSACDNNHGDVCNPTWSVSATTAIPGLEVLRLIDMVNGCLVETRSPCRYFTLSYVWGGVNNVRLTSSNKALLMEKSALRTIWRLLPRTIQDAIEVVKALGEGLLWIDALCLVQNGAVDMQNGIEVMDMIYERVALCIIAALWG